MREWTRYSPSLHSSLLCGFLSSRRSSLEYYISFFFMQAPSTSVRSISFGVLTAEEIRKLSVKRITKSELLDVNDRPVTDGLYDPALGPVYGSDL